MRYHIYQFSGKMDNFKFLGPNLPRNRFWGWKFKNLRQGSESASLRYYVHQFSDKTYRSEFLGQICPKQKWILGSKFQKSKTGFGISILRHYCAPIFRQNRQLWIFEPKFAQKWILGLGSKFEKSKPGFEINASKILTVPIFSQNGQLLVFRSTFWEIRGAGWMV